MSSPYHQLDSFVLSRMAATRLPGLSLVLVQDGRVVHERGYGMRDWHRGIPATPGTLYGIGSITKSFTCLAIMQLQEQGKLKVDDPVDMYLDFPVSPGGERVRIHHFMSHTSGIPALASAEQLLRQPLRASASLLTLGGAEDMLLFMDQAQDWVHARPGERWFYLNEGYVLLGGIIAKVSGLSYVDYVKRHILEPLGMKRSHFSRQEVEADPDRAVPSYFDPQGTYHAADYSYGKITSEGGMISSAQDMARYAQMYMDGGLARDGSRLLSSGSVAEMFRPRIATPPEYYEPLSGAPRPGSPAPNPTWYGYGLRAAPMGQHQVIGHGGSVFVATAEMAFIPARRTGVVVLTNASGYPCSQLAMYALAAAVGEDPEQLPFVQAERRLEALEGRYETYKGTTAIVVKRRGSFLVLENQDPVSPVTTLLVPEQLDDAGGKFWTLSGIYRAPAEFLRSGDRMELVIERYKYRRVGK